MVTTDINGVHLYIDGYLKQNLDIAKKRVQKNWDCIGLYVGDEGDGKTHKALSDAFYQDPNLNIDHVCFNPLQFEEAVDKAPPFSAIVYDEADDLGGHWANKLLLAIKRKFKRIRKKQLYIFLVTPTMFDLSKYFVIARTLYLIQVYTDGLERGYFKFYGKKGKRQLYMKGKKEWDMDAWGSDFKGRFTPLPENFPIDMSPDGEYETKKDLATAEIVSAAGIMERVDLYRGIAERLELDCVPRKKICYYLDKSLRQVERYLADLDRKLGDGIGKSALGGDIQPFHLPKVLSEPADSVGVENNE